LSLTDRKSKVRSFFTISTPIWFWGKYTTANGVEAIYKPLFREGETTILLTKSGT